MIQLPSEFIENIRRVEGIDADALAAALDTDPIVSIRFNRRKPHSGEMMPEIATGDAVEWCADGRYLSERPVFTLDPLLHAGCYYVQDASSMIYQQITEKIVEKMMAEGSRPLTALDFCAAPGGKTTAMIIALPDGSTVVANEYVTARGKILRENLEKWGYPGVIATGSASAQYRNLPAIFDIIAVDAPCSGEGMMRKEEEARRQWSRKLIADCAALQKEILSDVVGALRPGGYLIYSTCTFNTEEDEENSLFISEELGLQPVKFADLGLKGVDKAASGVMPGVEALRFMPHLTRGEGLYVSVFRKPESEGEFMATSRSNNRKNRKKGLPTEIEKLAEGWIKREIHPQFEMSGEMVTMIPEYAADTLETLRREGVNVTGAGLPIAELKSGKRNTELIPDSRIAINTAFDPSAFPEAQLDLDDALKYLRREAIRLDENIPKGYVVVNYKGVPLGMVKNLGNRVNNLYPSPWRIRI